MLPKALKSCPKSNLVTRLQGRENIKSENGLKGEKEREIKKERPNCIILNCVTVAFNYFIFYQLKDQTEVGLKTFANILCQFGHFGRFFDPHLAIYNQCDQIGQFFALWATF